MRYEKPALPIQDQIALLVSRGLEINDRDKAESYLSNISYYRLRAYTYPFQNKDDSFRENISLEKIIDLYVFDRKLRLLLLDAIEKIEISVRTQIIYQYSLEYGGQWHTDESRFRDTNKFSESRTTLEKSIELSTEDFIRHYREKYTDGPFFPPAWMALELSSLGFLSKMFKNLKRCSEKKSIAEHFGLGHSDILENWLQAFANVRNISAHHSRLWNRTLTHTVLFPKKRNLAHTFVDKEFDGTKIYAVICCVQYILNIISPNHTFFNKLRSIINDYPIASPSYMGFPNRWEKDPFWTQL